MQIDITLLEQLFNQSPDVAFFVKDINGRYLAVNESLVLRHGWKSKADVLGKRPSEICPGEFGLTPTRQDAKVIQTGKPLLDHLELQWHRPREATWCLTTKIPIRDAHGKITGLIGFSRDLRVPVEADEIPVRFAKTLAEFEEHLPSDVTPATLASRSGLTPNRLSRLTKRLFGLTPGQFITKIRIAAASRMLRDSDRSVSEIAHACGFYDHSAFTRAFRAATGMTPTKFREALKQ